MKKWEGKDYFGTIFSFIFPVKKILGFAILFFFVFLFSYSTAYSASSYYVDNSVASSGNGSQASPWKNLSNIDWSTISSASKPCTIYISGGATSQTYNQSLGIGASGSGLGNEIIIKRPTSAEWSGHSGIVYIRSSTDDAVSVSSQTWTIIDGLDLKSTYPGGKGVFFRDGANNNVLRNCTIVDNYGVGVSGYLSTNITVQKCTVGPPNVNGDDPMQFHGDNWIIEYNIIQGGMTPGPHFDDIQIGNGASSLNTIIRYNILREALSAGIAIYDHDMGPGENVSVYIYGNIIEFTNSGGANNAPGVVLSGSTAWCKAYVYNNTFVNWSYPALPNSGITMGGSNANNVYDIRNNIFYNSGFSIAAGAAGKKTFDYNVYYMTYDGYMTSWNGTDYTQSQFASYKAASGQDSHSLNTNPHLASVSATLSPNHDLRPTASSPGNNAGTVLGSPYNYGLTMTDVKSRWPFSVATASRGASYDIGPYEYSASGDTTLPQAPKNLSISSQ